MKTKISTLRHKYVGKEIIIIGDHDKRGTLGTCTGVINADGTIPPDDAPLTAATRIRMRTSWNNEFILQAKNVHKWQPTN